MFMSLYGQIINYLLTVKVANVVIYFALFSLSQAQPKVEKNVYNEMQQMKKKVFN